ncbi:MAG TPA: NAD(P)-dependent oxidoreductase [Gemmatimonadales bacterium]|jgi:3-hydroxyisobutyrate dehydrogenase-like beta-hydroxyacid dehydrogenase
MEVSFIGLGAMGRAMVANLLKAGHRVRVWNRSRSAVDELIREGAEAVAEPGMVFGGTVISMLADDTAVREVFLHRKLIEAAPPATVHVNMATISVSLAESLAAEHKRHKVQYVAAPVFGRPEAAAAAQLSIVAAGEEAALDRVQPLLDVLGQRTWRIGREPHQANAAKIAGNFLIASAIESMAEAAMLVERNGVPPEALLNVLTSTLFAAPVYKNYGAMIVERRYEPAAFRLALGLKDLRLVLEAAEAARTPMPFASVLRDHLLEAVAQGDGERDWAALAEVVRRHAGTDGGVIERRVRE